MNLAKLKEWAKVSKVGREEVSVHCPFHEDNRPSMYVNLKTWLYFCHGCGAKGKLTDDEKAPVTFGMIEELFAQLENDLSLQDSEVRLPEFTNLIEDKTSKEFNYLQSRGISLETAMHFGLCKSKKGEFKERIIIPFDEGGYSARSINPNEKFKYKHAKGMRKNNLLYNFDTSFRPVILVEGFFDVFRLYEHGYNATAILGVDLHFNQLEKLCKSKSKEVVVALDNDPAGKRGMEKAGETLFQLFHKVSSVRLPDNKDPGDIDIKTWRNCFDKRRKLEPRIFQGESFLLNYDL